MYRDTLPKHYEVGAIIEGGYRQGNHCPVIIVGIDHHPAYGNPRVKAVWLRHPNNDVFWRGREVGTVIGDNFDHGAPLFTGELTEEEETLAARALLLHA